MKECLDLARERHASMGGATRPIPGMEQQFWKDWHDSLAWAIAEYPRLVAKPPAAAGMGIALSITVRAK